MTLKGHLKSQRVCKFLFLDGHSWPRCTLQHFYLLTYLLINWWANWLPNGHYSAIVLGVPAQREQ